MNNKINIKIGDKIRVLPRTIEQHFSHGAVINPPILHDVRGYETTVRSIWTGEMEDESGNPVIEYEIETATGEVVSPTQVVRLSDGKTFDMNALKYV